jgi:pimeloyl-ACP methyl ester carboxylesterase
MQLMNAATKKLLIRTLKLLLIFYVGICILSYFLQEKFIFFPEKLDKSFQFSFTQEFREINVTTKEGKLINGLLFTTDRSKGLIFYLHGNAGSLRTWGDVAKRYMNLNYDVFILDYPGYGKSEGNINRQQQLVDDVQQAYDEMKKRYKEQNIVIVGYSIGTGPAAIIASINNPRLLILQAPYYSLSDLMKHYYPIIPTFLLKYKFETNESLKTCKMPVVVFHGDEDEVVYYGSSLKLKQSFKLNDTLITLKGQGHNGITDNPQYINSIGEILK